MDEIVIFRVWGAGEWRSMDADGLAAGLMADAALRPTTLTVFFQAAVGAGADLAALDALGEKWSGRFVDRAGQALVDGDLAGFSVLLALAGPGLDETTAGALQAAMAGFTLSAGQANWPEFDENGAPAGEPPAEFTAQWVAETLTAAGYSWIGSQWVR